MSSLVNFHMNSKGEVVSQSPSVAVHDQGEVAPVISMALNDGHGSTVILYMNRSQAAQISNFLDTCVVRCDEMNGMTITTTGELEYDSNT
jgi:hypothetical protein